MTTVTPETSGTITIGDDLVVNRLGFGAMRITGAGIWGDPPDIDQAKQVLHEAVDQGVNFIDTADAYGPDVSERLICEALFPYPSDLVIATKGGLVRPGPNEWTHRGHPDHLRHACQGSMERLQLDAIPLYQLHRVDPEVPIEESIGALVDLQREGKILHIGVSNVDEDELRRARTVATIVSVQNRYNVGDRSSESLVDLCEAEGMAFLPWAPIAGGRNDEAAVDRIAEAHGATAHQVVLAWLLARSPAMLPIPGTGSVAHLADNLAAADLELTDEEVAELTNAA